MFKILLSLFVFCSATVPEKPGICIFHESTINDNSVFDCSVIFSSVSLSPNATSVVTVDSLYIDPLGTLSMDKNDVIVSKNYVVLGGFLNIDLTGYTTNFTIIKSENGTITGNFTNEIPGFYIIYKPNSVTLARSSSLNIIVLAVSVSLCSIVIILGALALLKKSQIANKDPLKTPV
jgi:hypothetical protein